MLPSAAPTRRSSRAAGSEANPAHSRTTAAPSDAKHPVVGSDVIMSAGSGKQTAAKPSFPALAEGAASGGARSSETRSVRVPPHRYTPLKASWAEGIVKPLVEHLKLQVRMNTRTRSVEIRTSPATAEPGSIQRGEDFVRAFMLGFDVPDAVALLRLDDLYVESFSVTDVKPLKGDHLGRAIGRIAGIGGKTRFAIENATRTRIVVADSKVHILGAFANIQVARDAVCSLILGSPPGKVYNKMRNVASQLGARR